MAEQVIRFGVSDGAGCRAATWRVWTPTAKADVYLACRALGGTLKASLHQSGSWHVAYSQQAFEERVQGVVFGRDDRYLEKWPRPKPIADGVTLAFRIVTPHSSVASPIGDRDKKITWLPNCPPRLATEIDIIITSPSTPVTGWPGKNSMGTKHVGSYRLENGEVVWVIYWVIDMPDFSNVPKGVGRFYRGRTREDLKSANLRGIAFGEEPDGSRVIYDLAVTQKIS
jgi:hypothetical protein